MERHGRIGKPNFVNDFGQDTPLLLEKRVKSRFSQRIFRVVSPLALDGGSAWKSLLEKAFGTAGDDDGENSADNLTWEAGWKTKIQVGTTGVSRSRRIKQISLTVLARRRNCRKCGISAV